MLEKIFGKKSTGVVYILCAAFLLLMLAGSAALYFTREGGSLFTLVGYAAYTAIELVLISLPVFVQKKWRLYIPPAIEIGICLYAVLFLTGSLYYDPKTDIQVSVTPFVGGFVFAMTVFSILYSVSSLRAEKKSRRPSPLRVSVMTFFATELLVAVFYLTIYLIGLAVRAVTPGDITEFLTYSTAHQGGNFLFCVIGYFTARSRRAERYKIRSFKDADAAELDALKEKDRTQYTVIKNISEDDTDYRKLMRRAKANFFVGRIVYLAVYAVYLVHTCITFASRGRLGILIIVCLAAGFALTALVYVYEYYLFRKGSPNQRLRRLKIGNVRKTPQISIRPKYGTDGRERERRRSASASALYSGSRGNSLFAERSFRRRFNRRYGRCGQRFVRRCGRRFWRRSVIPFSILTGRGIFGSANG